MFGVGSIIVTPHAAHMARVRCKVRIKCLSCTEKQEGPTQVTQKSRHEFCMGACNQVERHGLYSGHYSGVFVAPKNAWNAESKHKSRAVPIALLAILALTTSTYSSLGVLQGWTPNVSYLKRQSTTQPHQPYIVWFHINTKKVQIQISASICWSSWIENRNIYSHYCLDNPPNNK